jgi:hypothetical protein
VGRRYDTSRPCPIDCQRVGQSSDNSRVNEAIPPGNEAVQKQSRCSLALRFMEGNMFVYALNLIYKLSVRTSLWGMRSSSRRPSAE